MEAKKMAMAGQRLEITSLLSSLVEELSSNFSVLFVSGPKSCRRFTFIYRLFSFLQIFVCVCSD
ncbi:hypothetical protein HanOQP8_Chr03g0112651 [Helianthus annuus]|nr:hypothetical protein HanOQP8_Chr03g0112651 [Helianthus annuus]